MIGTPEIIAELAQGYEGRPAQAQLLLKAAAASGADAAKYQLVFADELATPDYKHYPLFRSLEMADEVWEGLAKYATDLGIQLQLDIFGTRSLQLAERIGVSTVKLHGTDLANIGLLETVATSSIGRVLLGAGGGYCREMERAIGMLSRKQIVVLLGFQSYPTPTETNQISRIPFLIQRLSRIYPHVTIGFADHAPPESLLRYALAATALGAGARVLEKHLTLAQSMRLEDHESALNPDDFLSFAHVIRSCAEAFGATLDTDDFGMTEHEQNYRKAIRRHVVSNGQLQSGAPISPDDLVLKRTSAQNALSDLSLVYKRRAKRNLPPNQPITFSDIE